MARNCAQLTLVQQCRMYIYEDDNRTSEESVHIEENATVFQTEVFTVVRAASHLIITKNKSIVFNCDSNAAIMALDST